MLPPCSIYISLKQQRLQLLAENGLCRHEYAISSAAKGAGEENGSLCTPRGKHVIRAKIGAGLPENTVFVGRRPTGEIYSAQISTQLNAQLPERDFVLTRILWLSGLELGFNRLGQRDTMRRYIYIHGCPNSCAMGVPASHGCIRMRNRDLIELFDAVPLYTPVLISEE